VEALARDSGVPIDERHEGPAERKRPWGEQVAVPVAPKDSDDATLGRGFANSCRLRAAHGRCWNAARKLAARNGNNYLPLLKKPYERHRRPLLRLARILDIQSATQDCAVADSLAFVLTLEAHREAAYLKVILDPQA